MDELAHVTTTQGDISTLVQNHTNPDRSKNREGSPLILHESSLASSNQIYRQTEIFKKPSPYGKTGPSFYSAAGSSSQTAVSPRALVRRLAAKPGFQGGPGSAQMKKRKEVIEKTVKVPNPNSNHQQSLLLSKSRPQSLTQFQLKLHQSSQIDKMNSKLATASELVMPFNPALKPVDKLGKHQPLQARIDHHQENKHVILSIMQVNYRKTRHPRRWNKSEKYVRHNIQHGKEQVKKQTENALLQENLRIANRLVNVKSEYHNYRRENLRFEKRSRDRAFNMSMLVTRPQYYQMQNGIKMLAPSSIKSPSSTMNNRAIKPFSVKPSARDSCTFGAGNTSGDYYNTIDDSNGRFPKIPRSGNYRSANHEDSTAFAHVDKSLTLSFQPDQNRFSGGFQRIEPPGARELRSQSVRRVKPQSGVRMRTSPHMAREKPGANPFATDVYLKQCQQNSSVLPGTTKQSQKSLHSSLLSKSKLSGKNGVQSGSGAVLCNSSIKEAQNTNEGLERSPIKEIEDQGEDFVIGDTSPSKCQNGEGLKSEAELEESQQIAPDLSLNATDKLNQPSIFSATSPKHNKRDSVERVEEVQTVARKRRTRRRMGGHKPSASLSAQPEWETSLFKSTFGSVRNGKLIAKGNQIGADAISAKQRKSIRPLKQSKRLIITNDPEAVQQVYYLGVNSQVGVNTSTSASIHCNSLIRSTVPQTRGKFLSLKTASPINKNCVTQQIRRQINTQQSRTGIGRILDPQAPSSPTSAKSRTQKPIMVSDVLQTYKSGAQKSSRKSLGSSHRGEKVASAERTLSQKSSKPVIKEAQP